MKLLNWKLNGVLLVLLCITASISFSQESEASVKTKADELFQTEQFVEATPLYLHLLALNPRSTEYNFKYGTCLLFNSLKKQEAFKYLNYSITDPAISNEAYFYLGKAYHLIYQFDDAITYYQKYLEKAAGKPKASFDVARQIEMCENGKLLLSSLYDMVVFDKKEVDFASFFRLYNLSNIGGVILINADYQSKVDKKKGHIPLIHFPDGARTIYYASYGDVDRGQKDLYFRRKGSDGKWSAPQLVPGLVNSEADEDFPYLSPNGEYLYFSSKGHNSMGGYDVFRSKWDPASGKFGTPENLDFPISSPDHDLFYVVDSLEQNAYFASARQSTNGKIHVYKVRVDKVPAKVDSEDIIAAIQAKSELNVNVHEFNLEELEKAKGQNKTLAEIGLAGLSGQEIINKFERIQQKQDLTVSVLEQLASGGYNTAFDKASQVEKLQQEIKKDVANAANATSQTQKNELLLEASEKVDKIALLREEIRASLIFSDSILKELPKAKNLADDCAELTATVRKAVINEDNNLLSDAIVSNTSLIQEVETSKDGHPIDALLAKNEDLAKQKEPLVKQLKSYENSQKQLEGEIKDLRMQQSLAKAKDKPGIQSKIDSKEAELTLVQEEKERLEKKIDALTAKEAETLNQIKFIHQIQNTGGTKVVTKESVSKKLEIINASNARTLESYVKQQVKEVDVEHATGRSHETLVQESKARVIELQKDLDLAQQAVDKHDDLTPEEKVALKVKNIDQLDRKLTQELAKLDEGLAKTPGDARLEQQKSEIQATKEQLRQEKERLSDEIKTNDAIASTDNSTVRTDVKTGEPVAKTTPEQELKTLMPDYSEQLRATNSKGDKAQQLQSQIALDEQLIDKIDERLDQLFDMLVKNPMDEQMQNQKEALTSLKKEKEAAIAKKQEELDLLEQERRLAVESVTATTEMQKILPDYEEKRSALEQREDEASKRELVQLDQQALKTIDKTLSKLGTPKDPVQLRQKEVLEEQRAEIQERLEQQKVLLAQTDTNSSIPEVNQTSKLIQEIKPNHQQTLAAIDSSDKSTSEKLALQLKEEQTLAERLKAQLEKDRKALKKAPNDTVIQKRVAQVEELLVLQESTIEELQQVVFASAKNQIQESQLLAKIASDYKQLTDEQIEQLTSGELTSALEAEEKLQQAITKQIQTNQKLNEKNYSLERAAENSVLVDLLEQSKEKQNYLRDAAGKSTDAKDELASLESLLGKDFHFAMEYQASSQEEAKKQLQVLNELIASLDFRLDEEKKEQVPNQQLIADLEKHLRDLNQRKDQISSSSKMVTNEVVSATPKEQSINKLTSLKEQEKLLEENLKGNPINKGELEKQLKSNRDAQKQTERIIGEIQVAELTQAEKDLTQDLKQKFSQSALTEVVLERTAEKKNEDKILEKTAGVSLLNAANTVLRSQKLLDEHQQVFESEESLKEVRRRLELEEVLVSEELSKVAKDPKLTQELTNHKQVLQEALNQVEKQLKVLQQEQVFDFLNDEALVKPLSLEQEQEIARHTKYPELREKQRSINQQKTIYNQTKKELDELRAFFSTATDEDDIKEVIEEIRQKTKLLAIRRDGIAIREHQLDEELTVLGVDKQAWKNVLVRELPAQKASISGIKELIAPELAQGFEIRKNGPVAPNPVVKKVPMTVKTPSGLVYRVQVGAFAKPIPEHLFQEFTPVTGEKLENGITRYMAGYFGDRQKVLQAQQDIRALGYTDAFVVAYCDGQRISLAEARRLEEQNLCRPMRQDSLVMQLIENTIAELPAEVIQQYVSEPKVSDYNKAPGAVPAMASEEIKGLFYTVQVGVYNRPATSEQLRYITPLVTMRLDNGQIRYSSGIFRSVEEARPKKAEAIEKGITDAFITAYYNGQRISLQEAKALLQREGESILFREAELPKAETQTATEQEVKKYVQENAVVEVVIPEEHTLVSRATFETYPRKELELLRLLGNFYYDQQDKRIKSFAKEELPRLIGSSLLFDTLTQEKTSVPSAFSEPKEDEVVVFWKKEQLSAPWANWLLRLTFPHTVISNEEGIYFILQTPDEKQREQIKKEVERLKGVISF